MRYRLVRARTIEETELAVNILLDKGWVLHGGLAIDDDHAVQPMINHSLSAIDVDIVEKVSEKVIDDDLMVLLNS